MHAGDWLERMTRKMVRTGKFSGVWRVFLRKMPGERRKSILIGSGLIFFSFAVSIRLLREDLQSVTGASGCLGTGFFLGLLLA